MNSEKLEAFVDAVLAIILTVIVLELPQPETITLAGFWALNAQLCYCTFFIVIELAYDVLFWMITKIEHNKELKDILNLKRTVCHLVFYAIGIMLGVLITPEIIVVFVFIAVLTWFVHVYMSIKYID
ncbi:MAG: DUF1211 domain-containing protein [Methanobrevibacter sp.]|uniref:TMEM175 family protein n=1 Tax=Methanobrevibacter sp. TaxID=66852 RepID=UPI001B61AB42|nr:TMEM175 family protein [Methanobrevibacter sp.]MBP3792057.1 DUF1211 domain-containing protein [Methanobrevibacter sp.]